MMETLVVKRITFETRRSPANPVDAQRRFNVYKTSVRRRWRRVDVL